MSERKRRVAVAGSYAQYRDYLREHGITHRDLPLVNAMTCHGLGDVEVVRVGTDWENPDSHAALRYLLDHGASLVSSPLEEHNR